MSSGDEASRVAVNAFPIGGRMLMKQYFDGDEVFDRLQPYYNGTQYRFEVPAAEFDSLRRFLYERGYDVGVVDLLEPYYVVVPQYSEHPGGIFKSSVHHQAVDGYNCFLLADRDAVEAAVREGATRLTNVSLELRSQQLSAFATSSP
jgi:hypothetical protein